LAQFLFPQVLLRISKGTLPVICIIVASLHGPRVGADERVPNPNVRDVTPPGIVRVYGAPSGAGAVAAEIRQFDNVRVLPDGTLRSGDVTSVLYGIVLPARSKLCVTQAGARWACGVSAIGALRNMVQTKSIACTVHDDGEGDKGQIIGFCRTGQSDISLRLLEQGWAMPDESVKERRYIEAAQYGRDKNFGLWARGPSTSR
jgi:endonuclease YncB( thermonuclease family)